MEGAYQLISAKKPGELVTVDFYSPLLRSSNRYQYIFVVLDAFSKYVKLYPIRQATTIIVVNKIRGAYIEEFGKPAAVLADNGSQFTSRKWRDALAELGIKSRFCSIRHPQSNPTERVMKELGRFFRVFCAEAHSTWAKYIPQIEELLNITTDLSTGYTPYELQFGKRPQDGLDTLLSFPENNEPSHEQKILLANDRILKNFYRRRDAQKSVSAVVLNIGDLVLLRVPYPSSAIEKVTAKFFHLYYGPYRLSEKYGENAYRLVDPENPAIVKGTYNRSSLRKYYPSVQPACNILYRLSSHIQSA